ncbi:MAG TPA: hypothetical protein VGI39_17195 [Polyangiaceae bacterium]
MSGDPFVLAEEHAPIKPTKHTIENCFIATPPRMKTRILEMGARKGQRSFCDKDVTEVGLGVAREVVGGPADGKPAEVASQLVAEVRSER